MPLTILDIIVIVVVLISATLAMVRGFVREVLSVASWVAAVAAAYYFHGPITLLIKPYIDSVQIATIVAAALVFFIALILASYLTTRVADFVIDSRVGAIDRILGFLFGAARGLLLVVIALWFFEFLSPTLPDWVADAQTLTYLQNLQTELLAVLPENLEEELEKLKPNGDEGEPAPPSEVAPAGDATANPADPNYGTGTRQNLDQLFQNSDN